MDSISSKSINSGALIIRGNEFITLVIICVGVLPCLEREITGAIRYVTSDEMPIVYFVQGNGETDPSSTMTKAVASLEQDAFEVRTLRLTEVSV
jgi:ABC-2 type transport system permease protein